MNPTIFSLGKTHKTEALFTCLMACYSQVMPQNKDANLYISSILYICTLKFVLTTYIYCKKKYHFILFF